MEFTLLLLPGMDGTGTLFQYLLRIIPPEIATRVIAYPSDQALSYDELVDRIATQISSLPSVVIVAESFSGPVALRLARRCSNQVKGIVLSSTFITSPLPRWLPIALVTAALWVPMTRVPLRLLLLGKNAPAPLVHDVISAIRSIPRRVMVARIREVMRVDAAEDLRACSVPILCLVARNDRVVPARCAASLCAARDGLEVVEMEGPHLLLQVNPREAWEQIASFVEKFP